ncbi:AraC family transcriptional regulator [Gracilibacillus kekensis]|uniref:Two component transcriptional regulator, AraC family n=1 Tax=Gracilibacillus kekensis TaxID=1027249 RepID=A0A1M7QI18_9BACI|nr:AraC family transcriptional regulator [Gracilibacillus kekensis]SHN30413.1 two component transcriptional regulator, AraC family [Gracilibacillus kekensis]
MIKVMLVDDEAIEREGIQMILGRNRSDFEVVAEAKNGREAVELALTHQPNLIFMDIKMPEFDGLVAIEKILAEQPQTKCIMVSAFDTFRYAKRAMKFGIKEYLLKPSKVKEVLEAYDRMVEEIEQEKVRAEEKVATNHRLERASSLVEMEFILTLMMDHVHEFEAEDWKEWLDLQNTKGAVAVFSFTTSKSKISRQQKINWYQALKQALEETNYAAFIGPLTGFQVPVFVKCNQENMKVDQFVRDVIQATLKNLTDSQLHVGVGGMVSELQQFSRSYEQAIYALELVQSQNGAKYLIYTDQLESKRKELLPFEEEKALIEAVKKGDYQTGMQRFDSYFQWIQKNTEYKIHLIKKSIENFFIVLTRTTKELGIKDDFQMTFTQFETTMQIKEAAKYHLSTVMKQVSDWRSKGVRGLLLEAKEYMEQHYSHSLRLEEVADKVGLSSYYFSKLFKEHFQVTFVEYLTSYRLEKAKTLLLDDNMPLKEIALTIGYKDPNYFSRVFKKEFGISPTEYRNQH